MDAADKRAERQRIEEEAASLVVRAAGGDASATAAALRWAAQSPVHGVALAQARAAWASAERLRAVVPQDGEPGTPSPHAFRPSRRMMIGGGGVAAAAATLPAVWGVSRLLDRQRLETRIGEQRRFALDDGSVLHLNTDTLIELATDGGRRTVTMIRGEALFDVTATAARSLIVVAGTAMLNAFLTAFDLSVRGDLAELVVARGMVTILGKGRTRTVLPGNSATIENDAVAVVSLPSSAIDRRLAWRRGMIDLGGQTLAQATEEFNRYLQHPIIVADPSLASLRLGGTFSLDESDAFIAALQRSFPINAVRSADGSTLLMAASCSPGSPGQVCGGSDPR